MEDFYSDMYAFKVYPRTVRPFLMQTDELLVVLCYGRFLFRHVCIKINVKTGSVQNMKQHHTGRIVTYYSTIFCVIVYRQMRN